VANDYVMNDKLMVHEKYPNNATSRGPVLHHPSRMFSCKHARAHAYRVGKVCSATTGNMSQEPLTSRQFLQGITIPLE
jgi:hypothetical protein